MRSKVLVPLLSLIVLAAPALADTFIMPHMLEASGRASLGREPGTTDTVIHVTNAAALPGTVPSIGNEVTITGYSPLGTPYVGAGGTSLCAPCTFTMGSNGALHISVIDMMTGAGLIAPAPEDGYLVIETLGPDAAVMDVTVETVLYLPTAAPPRP